MSLTHLEAKRWAFDVNRDVMQLLQLDVWKLHQEEVANALIKAYNIGRQDEKEIGIIDGTN